MKLSPNYSLLALIGLLFYSLLTAQTAHAQDHTVNEAFQSFNDKYAQIARLWSKANKHPQEMSLDEYKKLSELLTYYSNNPREISIILEADPTIKNQIDQFKSTVLQLKPKIDNFLASNNALPNETALSDAKDSKFANCDDELRRKLNNLITDDKEGILKKQFELTTLKLAQKVQNNNQTTLEDYVQSKAKEIKEKDTSGKIDELKKLYANEGKAKSLLKVYEHIDTLKESADKASYWNKNLRFYNEDASSFLLFEKMMDKESNFNETDVAITWYMQKLTKENRGSAKTNQNNLSYNLTKLLGGMSAFKAKSQNELKEKTEKLSKDIDLLMTSTIDALKENLAMCFQDGLWKGGCEFTTNHLNNEINLLLLTANEASSELLEGSPVTSLSNFSFGKNFMNPFFNSSPLSLTINRSILNSNKRNNFFQYNFKFENNDNWYKSSLNQTN